MPRTGEAEKRLPSRRSRGRPQGGRKRQAGHYPAQRQGKPTHPLCQRRRSGSGHAAKEQQGAPLERGGNSVAPRLDRRRAVLARCPVRTIHRAASLVPAPINEAAFAEADTADNHWLGVQSHEPPAAESRSQSHRCLRSGASGGEKSHAFAGGRSADFASAGDLRLDRIAADS
jgi:hypothetical protein